MGHIFAVYCHFWVYSWYKMAIYIIRPFWFNASAAAGAYRIGPHFWVFRKITSYYATCFLEGTFILPVSVKMHANMQGGHP